MRFCKTFLFVIWSCSLSISVMAQTNNNTGGGGGVGANLNVELTVSPADVIWGNLASISTTVSGGTPAPHYGVLHSVRCPGDDLQEGVGLSFTPGGEPAVSYWPAKVVGPKIARSVAADSLLVFGEKEVTFNVLPPEKIVIKNPNAPAAVGTITLVESQPASLDYVGSISIIFEVLRGTDLVGPHATGLAQESTTGGVSDGNGGLMPGPWSAWVPTETALNFFFQSPFIYDEHLWLVKKGAWDKSVEDGGWPIGYEWVLFQKVRLPYKDCAGTTEYAESPIYKIIRRKTGPTTIDVFYEVYVSP